MTLKRPIGGGGPASEMLTVRDSFASEAARAFLAGTHGLASMPDEEVKRQFDEVGRYAYMMADSMMKARSA